MATNGKTETVKDPYALPSPKDLQAARDLTILDEQGKKTTFGAVLTPKADTPRQLVVFIRHFFCGHCEEYIRELAKGLAPSTLASATPSTHLTVIGCGSPSVVVDYKTRTGCPYPIYCDPDRRLYDKLGMVITLDLGPTKPDYIKSSLFSQSLNSMLTILKSGPKGLTGGKFSQNGGEWIFDGEGELVWCRRMTNTRDHAEVEELEKVLGLKEESVKAETN